jgi:hypothetical protein
MALTPEQQILGEAPELQDVSRQRKLAELLLSQGMQQPQGQMISGYYVAPSWTQQINPIANILAGQAVGERADTKQAQMAKALRDRDAADVEEYARLQEIDPAQAIRFGLKSQSPTLKQIVAEDLKTVKYGEGEIGQRRNIATGQIETVGRGGEKYRAPIQIDTGTAIELRDPLDPTKVISRMPKSQMPTAGQVVETENGPMLVNTRTGQAQPIMAGGQTIAGSPKLTETQSNATAFGMRAKEANRIANELEKAGTTNTGIIRSAISGTVGMAPFVGGKMSQGVESAMNVLPGALGGPSEEQQQTAQARRNFISAVLRKESGAAIPPDEYANEEKKYFPEVGDLPKNIEQKRQARELAIKALEIQAGPGAKQIKAVGGGTDTGVVDFNSLPKRN